MAQSRRCPACQENWPPHLLSCPLCQTKTKESQNPPMDQSEFKWLTYTKGKRPLCNLPKSEKDRMDAEWEALEAEEERRSPWWSICDLIAEGWPKSVRDAA